MGVSLAGFFERTRERGLVRDRRRADRANADVRGNAIDGEAESRKHQRVALWLKSVKRPRWVCRRASTPPERRGERVVRGPDDRDHERLREGTSDRVGIARRELAPLPVLAYKAAKSAERELVPLVLAGKSRESQEPIGRESVLFDRSLTTREASRLAARLRRIEESAAVAILEPVAERHRHPLRSTERARVEAGLVRVEAGGQIGRDVSKEVHDLHALGRIGVVQRFRLRIPQRASDRPHRLMRPRLKRIVTRRSPGRPQCGRTYRCRPSNRGSDGAWWRSRGSRTGDARRGGSAGVWAEGTSARVRSLRTAGRTARVPASPLDRRSER